MKIKAMQGEGFTVLGITVTKVDQQIAESNFFLCLWTENSRPDEKMMEQVATAIMLKKPFIVVRKKGVEFPDDIRKLANIVEEFEWADYPELKVKLDRAMKHLLKHRTS